MRTVIGLIAVAAVAYMVIVVLLYLYQHRLVYFPSRTLQATPATLGWDYEDVTLTTEDDVRLHGWYVPAPSSRGVLLFFHGNAGNISHRFESIRIFRDLGLDVFIFDYRGYGKSEGSPSEEGTYLDGWAAWEHLVNDRQIDRERIVLFGRSLGAAVAAHVAARTDPAGLILESAFSSMTTLGQELYPWLPVRQLIRFEYDIRARLPEIAVPVLVAHSQTDEIIPYRHGRALYEAARGDKFFLEMRGGHNDGFLVTGSPYIDGLDAFLTRVLGQSPASR